jgi:hypothetical protein
MWPVIANLAVDLTKLDAHSALPRAPRLPVPPPKETGRQKVGRSLRETALRLQRLADRVDAPATC